MIECFADTAVPGWDALPDLELRVLATEADAYRAVLRLRRFVTPRCWEAALRDPERVRRTAEQEMWRRQKSAKVDCGGGESRRYVSIDEMQAMLRGAGSEEARARLMGMAGRTLRQRAWLWLSRQSRWLADWCLVQACR